MRAASGVLICGGGTGGHVFPGLALAAACRRLGIGDLRWIGDRERLEGRLVPAAGIDLLPCGWSRPRRRDPRWYLTAVMQTWAMWRIWQRRRPAVVVALGGYAALAPGLLAVLDRRPLVVMEQNALPGRSNRLLARWSRAVITQFAEAAAWLPRAKVRLLGNPVRTLTAQARGRGPGLRLLVMGGSLGARSLNDLLIAAAPALAAITGLSLVHLAGEEDRERVAAAYHRAGLAAEVMGFCDDMPALYDRVDLVLGRSGATSVAECCAAGLGALYIPLPWAADDHQRANARAVARLGGAVLLSQSQISPAGLVRVLTRLAARPQEVARLGQRARLGAHPQAADDVARLVADLGGRR